MNETTTGIKGGEFRRLTAAEIATLVRMVRRRRGIKQAALAASASVSERSLERLEQGASMNEQTYKQVAIALQLDPDLFLTERYIPTPGEALKKLEEQHDAIEKDYTRVGIAALKDPRQIMEMLNGEGFWFDNSKIDQRHLEKALVLQEAFTEANDYVSELPYPKRLEIALELLTEAKALESLGYRIRIGTYRTRVAETHLTLGVVAMFPTAGFGALPDELLVPNEVSFA